MLCFRQLHILQGRVQFPTGGKVRQHESAESVKFRYRQYSLDERRNLLAFCALSIYSGRIFCEEICVTELWQTLVQNISFVLMCVAIIAGLSLAAHLTERFLPSRRKVTPARRVSIVGICGAIAAVLHILDFPLLFMAPEFYKLDFSEVPVLLCGFYLGPSATVACEGVKILLKLLLKGTSTAFVGDFANFAVGCSLVLPAAILYHVKKTRKGAVLGMVVGTLTLTVFGSAFNAVYLLPKFSQLFGLPLDNIIAMGTAVHAGVKDVTTFVLLCVAPLNLLKGVAVSMLTALLYKRVEKVLFRERN